MNNLVVNGDGLEVPELVVQLPVLFSSSKEVDAFEDGVGFSDGFSDAQFLGARLVLFFWSAAHYRILPR